MEPVFLTGATGTIGSAILEALVGAKAFSVDCLVRRPESRSKIERAGGNVLLGDMADADRFRHFRAHRHYRYIIHAAQAHYSDHTETEISRLDRQAVANLEILRTNSTKLMIYTGGVWVFGHQARLNQINEETPHRPLGAAKDRSELMLQMLRDRTSPWSHLCPPSFVYGSVGPLQSIAQAMRIAPLDVIADESVLWSVVERTDLARAYLALLERSSPGEFYVVSEDDPVPAVSVYETVARLIPGAKIIRRERAYFESRLTPDRIETKYASQPVNAAHIRNRTGWRSKERFITSVNRYLI